MMAKKPVVTAEVINEFGPVEASAIADNGRIDGLYTPGFTDMRRERDQKLLEFAEGDITGKEVPVLPVNLRYTRNSNVKSGDPDSTRLVQTKGSGYRAVTKDDVKKPWLKDLPPGADWAADGTLRKGDLTLMVADQGTAARNRFRSQTRTMQAVDGAASTKMEELRRISVESEPTVTQLPSRGPIKSADVFNTKD
jgi:hypothetical protein